MFMCNTEKWVEKQLHRKIERNEMNRIYYLATANLNMKFRTNELKNERNVIYSKFYGNNTT